MSLSTYDGLKVSVADWLNREDLGNVIPDFIELAENRIFHELRTPVNEKTIILTLSADGYASLPSDFLEAKDVFWNYNPLARISLTELHNYVSRTGAAPEAFARETYRLRFFPVPTVQPEDELRMIYYFDAGRLTSSANSNVVFSAAPELFLYGTLVEATNYLGGDISRWEGGYQNAMGRLMQHSAGAETAGATATVKLGY
tara:strand:+ start:40 stop:642 length:603 start_codon:yes stop_codon:yes gene_type:complete